MNTIVITGNVRRFILTITALTTDRWCNLTYKSHPELGETLRMEAWVTGCRDSGNVDGKTLEREVDIDTYEMCVASLPKNRTIAFHDEDAHVLFTVGSDDNTMTHFKWFPVMHEFIRVLPEDEDDIEAVEWIEMERDGRCLDVQWPIEATPKGRIKKSKRDVLTQAVRDRKSSGEPENSDHLVDYCPFTQFRLTYNIEPSVPTHYGIPQDD